MSTRNTRSKRKRLYVSESEDEELPTAEKSQMLASEKGALASGVGVLGFGGGATIAADKQAKCTTRALLSSTIDDFSGSELDSDTEHESHKPKPELVQESEWSHERRGPMRWVIKRSLDWLTRVC